MPVIRQFGGLAPRRSRHLLPEGAASRAHDVKLRNGRLEAWREKLPVALAASDSLSFHAWSCCYLRWPGCVSASEYLPDYGRLYLTGRSGRPEVATRIGCELSYFYLGVPAPENFLALTAAESFGEESDARTYVYTYVNQFGEESAPSPPSRQVTVADGSPVLCSGFAPPPEGYGILGINLYRSATGARSGAEKEQSLMTGYLLVAELDSDEDFTDAVLIRHLGPDLDTRENRLPPAGLRHLHHINGSGVLVGATVNQVHFSENFQPGNWPAEYDLTLPDNIVNLVTLDNWVFVSTDGKPVVIDGTPKCESRQGRQVRDVDTVLPDISCGYAHSAAATPFGMVYASLDGLVLVKSDASFEVLTNPWYGRDDWLKLRPETVRLAYWRGYLVCVTEAVSFLLELDGQTYGDHQAGALSTISDRPLDMTVTENGELLLLENGVIYQWDAGASRRPYIWESKELYLAGESSPGLARLRTEDGVLFRLLSPKEDLYFDRLVTDEQPFRLGRLGRHKYYRVGLYGVGRVDFLELGGAATAVQKEA
jgi:hypothetical protein